MFVCTALHYGVHLAHDWCGAETARPQMRGVALVGTALVAVMVATSNYASRVIYKSMHGGNRARQVAYAHRGTREFTKINKFWLYW